MKQRSRPLRRPVLSTLVLISALFSGALLLGSSSVSAAGERWIALPNLEESVRQGVVRDFHARGTRNGMTLVVATEVERRALFERFDGVLKEVTTEQQVFSDADGRAG